MPGHGASSSRIRALCEQLLYRIQVSMLKGGRGMNNTCYLVSLGLEQGAKPLFPGTWIKIPRAHWVTGLGLAPRLPSALLMDSVLPLHNPCAPYMLPTS